MNHGMQSGVQKRNPAGEKRSLSTACHRRHRLCRIYMVFRPPKQKSRPCIQHAGTGQKSNPAVPPGLTQMRPTHPYHHTVALFTECRSVAHRAGTPPSDCPPKSIHTIQSVPRSQLCAALCDILKTGYLLFINGFNSLMKLFWILLLHCDKVKRKFFTLYSPARGGGVQSFTM